MAGRQDYVERKEARIDRLNAASTKAAKEASKKFEMSHNLVKDIPLGQPNIIGRPALPRLRERSINALEQAVKLNDKADYY